MKNLKVTKENNFIKLGRHYYFPEYNEETASFNFIKMTKREVMTYQRMREKILNKVVSSVNPREVLDDALSDLTLEELKGVHHNLFKAKRRPKPHTEPGCIELRVGQYVIPIR